jgi:hypothetical protein
MNYELRGVWYLGADTQGPDRGFAQSLQTCGGTGLKLVYDDFHMYLTSPNS